MTDLHVLIKCDEEVIGDYHADSRHAVPAVGDEIKKMGDEKTYKLYRVDNVYWGPEPDKCLVTCHFIRNMVKS